MNVSNSAGVTSSNSVRRPKSKDTKSHNRVLKNTNDKSSSTHVRKVSSSVSIRSNKRETNNSTVYYSNASVLNTKIVNAVNDGSNIVCVSCGKDVFMLSHKKYVARYALSRDSRVKRALFTTPIAVESRNLGATSVFAKSKLSVAKTLTATIKRVLEAYDWQSSTAKKFIEKFMGTVHFGNDHFAAITGYGDYVQGNLTICHVYYVKGLRHNLFMVGQFCVRDLELAIRSNTCYVWNLEGDDLLTGSRESNLYTISIFELAASSPVCLMSKVTSTKSWLWHQRLSHLNFGTINQLTSKDLVDGLSKFKYDKDHLGSACEQGKRKKASFPSKLIPSIKSKLKLLHMDLCGPIRVESSNSKKYFLCTNDEAPDMIINFINQVQWSLKAQILKIRTDNGTEFKYKKLQSFCAKLDSDTPQIVTSSEEPITQESLTPVLEIHFDEQIQKHVAELDGNTIMHSFELLELKEAESSLNYQDPLNMHEFH
ncbi:integrase, catalytic region, zinc finger, CCHC-type containing protein [Tanacetum coccineum]